MTTRAYRVGDRVVVRSQAEILATLSEAGELDSLPFMPEMLKFCGQQLTVEKLAHKACDSITMGPLRRMDDAVHLSGARCDGSAHGGCENRCLLYWKDDWLRRVDEPAADAVTSSPAPSPLGVDDLRAAARRPPDSDGTERFACQTTELNRATPRTVGPFDIDHYVADLQSGNSSLYTAVRAYLVGIFNGFQGVATRRLPRRLRFRGGRRWRFLAGRAGLRTPSQTLDLQPGERVRIKSKDQILDTLNSDLRNRGLGFDAEMARSCGREAVVERRVARVIDESTGRLVQLNNPCIVLAGVHCRGAYTGNCPRSFISFWREIWLERVDAPPGSARAPR